MKGESSKDVSCPCRTCCREAVESRCEEFSSLSEDEDDDEVFEEPKKGKHSSGKSQKEPHDLCRMLDDRTWKTLISLRQKACKFLNSEAEDLSAISDATLDNEEFRPGPNFMKKAKVLIDYEPESAFLRKIKENYLQNNDIQNIMAACSGNTGYAICEDCSEKVKSKQMAKPEKHLSKVKNVTESKSRESRGDGCKCRSQVNINSPSSKKPETRTPNKESPRTFSKNQHFDSFSQETKSLEYRGKENRIHVQKSLHKSRSKKRLSKQQKKQQQAEITPSQDQFEPTLKRPHENSCERCWKYASTSRSPVNRPDQRYDPNFRKAHSCTEIVTPKGGEGNVERHVVCKDLEPVRSSQSRDFPPRKQRPHTAQFPLQNSEYSKRSQPHPTPQSPPAYTEVKETNYEYPTHDSSNQARKKYASESSPQRPGSATYGYRKRNDDFQRTSPSKKSSKVSSSLQRPKTGPSSNQKRAVRTFSYHSPEEMNKAHLVPKDPHPQRHHEMDPCAQRQPMVDPYVHRQPVVVPDVHRQQGYNYEKSRGGKNHYQQQPDPRFQGPPIMDHTYVRLGGVNNVHQQPVMDHCYQRQPIMDPYCQRQVPMDPYFQKQPTMNYKIQKPGTVNDCFQQKHPHHQLHQQQQYLQQQASHSRYQSPPMMNQMYQNHGGMSNNMYDQQAMDPCYQRQTIDPTYQKSGRMTGNFHPHPGMDPCYQRPPVMDYDYYPGAMDNNYPQQAEPKFQRPTPQSAPKTMSSQSGSPPRFKTPNNCFETNSKCRCSPPETIQEEEVSKPKSHSRPSTAGNRKSTSPSLELSVSITGHKKRPSSPRPHSASLATERKESESRRSNQDPSPRDTSKLSHTTEFEETQYLEFERKIAGAGAANYESSAAALQRQISTPKKPAESPSPRSSTNKTVSERRNSKSSQAPKSKKRSTSGKRSRSSSLKNFDQKKSTASGSPKSTGRPRTAGSSKSGTKKRSLSKSPKTKTSKNKSRIEECPEYDEYMPPTQSQPMPYGQNRVSPCVHKTDNLGRMILGQKHPINECRCSFKIPKSRPTFCCHCDDENLHMNENNEESFYRNPDPSFLRRNYHDSYDPNENRNYSSYNPDYSFNIDDGSYRYSEPEYSLDCIDPAERAALQQQCYRECLRQLSERCRSRGPTQMPHRPTSNFGGNPPRKYSVFYMTKSKEGEGNEVEVIVEELTQKISNEKVPKSKPVVEKMKKILDCPTESMALRFQKGVSESNENPPSSRILYF